MLRPGLGRPPTDRGTLPLSAAFTRFGGGKFKLAAQKMRYLDEKKLGRFHPETIERFGKTVPEKFKQVQRLLHLPITRGRDVGFWTEIEKPLPNQQPSRLETPPQPGELRPGTVIQKFPMFPKPGQSIESFKEQVRSIPKAPSRVVPQTPRLDPKSRLFSRIQEITDHEEKSGKEPLEKPSTPEVSPVAESPQPSVGETVQRQEEIPSEAGVEPPEELDATQDLEPSARPEPEMEVHPDLSEREPPKIEKLPSEGAEIAPPLPTEPPKLEAETAPPTKPSLKLAQPAQKDRPLPGIRALPKAKSRPVAVPLPKAKPSSTQAPQVQRSPDAPKPPRARPVTGTVTPADDQIPPPQTVSESQLRGDIVQALQPSPAAETLLPPSPETQRLVLPTSREAALPAPPPKSKLGLPQETEAPLPVPTEKIPPAPPPAAAVKAPAPELREGEPPLSPLEQEMDTTPIQPLAERVEGATALEMPLRRKIESRMRVPGALKSLEPEIIRPTPAAPLLIQRESPLVPARKYRPPTQPSREPETPVPPPFAALGSTPPSVQDQVPIHFAAEGPVAMQRQTPPIPLEGEPGASQPEPLSMSLAYPSSTGTRQMMPAPQPTASLPLQSAQLPSMLETPEERSLELMPETERPEPVSIPRVEDQPSEPGKIETVRRIDEPAEEESEIPEIDLDQLAEKVLPKVKRILEIESERLSRYRG